MRNVSFYSSELKNVGQIVTQLQKIADGEFEEQGEVTKQRYENTLSNMGLVVRKSGSLSLTEVGTKALQLGVTIGTSSPTPPELTLGVDSIVFRELVDELRVSKSSGARSDRQEYFISLLENAQQLLDGIPPNEREEALDDLDLLLFLQCIHCVGYEVARFYRLPLLERQEVRQAWNSALESFPENEPADFIEQIAYLYLRPVAKNNVQADIRYRVQSFLRSYQNYSAELGDEFPRLDRQRRVINLTRAMEKSPITPTYKLEKCDAPTPLKLPRQWIVCGCPGSGKSTYLSSHIKEMVGTHLVRTTFHTETSYFDFVGSYKPVPVYEKSDREIRSLSGDIVELGRPIIDYQFVPGAFSQAFVRARLNPEWNIVLIIEELNRANSGAVFGDMFQLLDRHPDKGESIYAIQPSPDFSGYLCSVGLIEDSKAMRLPGNLYIWATMNNADQGVLPVDSAFRRRWEFHYRGFSLPCEYPEADRKILYAGKAIDWDVFRKSINEFLITQQIHEDKLIGPYFLSIEEIKDPRKVLNKLFLYLWEDVLRFQHRKLMDFNSFSELDAAWASGAGAPLKVRID